MASGDLVQVCDVRFEHYRPQYTIGLDEGRPRISWRYRSGISINTFQQSAYEIEVIQLVPHTQGDGNFHDVRISLGSVRVDSPTTKLVPWPLETSLQPRERVSVRVRAYLDGGGVTDWSEEAIYEVGLGGRENWECQRITSTHLVQGESLPVQEQLFCRVYQTELYLGISRARLYLAVQGVYVVEINNRRVSADILAPGWTDYNNRIRYQTYDVTNLLEPSTNNVIVVRLAEGWFCGRLGFAGGRRDRWGSCPTLMAQLEVTYDNGCIKSVHSDTTWNSRPGPAVKAELYDGEKYDARLALPAFRNIPVTGDIFSDHPEWKRVSVMGYLSDSIELVAGYAEPVRQIETLGPKQVFTTPLGKTVVDFGQNLVGYVRLRGISGARGAKITLRHAEVLEDGELGLRPLRVCDAMDEYLCDGSVDATWEPTFTYHGFRYCQVDGWSGTSDLAGSIEAVVCHNDMEPTGEFSCSNPMLNKLFNNAKWSMKGNFLSIPTDCPQRDERLGWTGDIAQFAPAAAKLFNCSSILKDWMVDVTGYQAARGGIPPYICPDIFDDTAVWSAVRPVAIWHDVVILVPWALHQATGDVEHLSRNYASMKDWINAIPRDQESGRRIWDRSSFQLGDWLDPTAPPDQPMAGQTDPLLVADAFLVRSLDLMARIAKVLGISDDVEKYSHDWSSCRQQFRDEYITPNGRVSSDSQTAYTLAIVFDLLDSPREISFAGQRLATIVRQNNFKIGTGFAGTPFLCEALVRTGHTQVAFATLLCEECPSWLYPITMGATTMWERWDSMLPSGAINPGEMTSFNHYCFGSVITFLFERLAGLKSSEPGWNKLHIAPTPGGGITSAYAEQLTPYGLVTLEWSIKGENFDMELKLPALVEAEIVFPPGVQQKNTVVGRGKHTFSLPYVGSDDWPVKAISAFPDLTPPDRIV